MRNVTVIYLLLQEVTVIIILQFHSSLSELPPSYDHYLGEIFMIATVPLVIS